MPEVSYAVITGAGSAGLTWNDVAGELGAIVLPIPDEAGAPAMAAALESAISALPRPRVLIAASMGAIVALEVVRTVEVDALVLAAAGYGIDVSDRLLSWMISDPPELFEKMARICVADKNDRGRIDAIVVDYVAGGHAVHVRHLQALAGYRPEPLPDPPPTIAEGPAGVTVDGCVQLARTGAWPIERALGRGELSGRRIGREIRIPKRA